MRAYYAVHDVSALDVQAPSAFTRDDGTTYVEQTIGGVSMYFAGFEAWREWHVEMSTVGMNFVVSHTLALQQSAKAEAPTRGL